MSENSSASSRGIGFFSLLGLLFIGLKLGGIINWSWWFVLLPLYGPLGLFLIILVIAAIFITKANRPTKSDGGWFSK